MSKLHVNGWMETRWIDGYEGAYAITEDGEVISFKGSKGKKLQARYLSLGHNTGGYKQVDLHKHGTRTHRDVHRLVAETFIPKPYEGLEVDHINRDKTDNSIENLRWVTHSENMRNRSKSR